MSASAPSRRGRAPRSHPPRVGFLGAGWIGRHRLQALSATGLVEPVAVADSDPGAARAAVDHVPRLEVRPGIEELLAMNLDGLVIATPSALHAEQAVAALEAGAAVFCQKPMARDAEETARVLDAARGADLLVATDLSYRHLEATRATREALTSGALGRVYAADLAFHNAYGPDRAWFRRRSQSGGGCLIDLGTHLLDLLRSLTGSRGIEVQAARVLCQGRRLEPGTDEVEDHAAAQLVTDAGATVQLACSWNLAAGRDCVFECSLYGTEGGITIRNVDGSFYDFIAEHRQGTAAQRLVEPPDDWGGRAIAAWGARLAQDRGFDPEAEDLLGLAVILDSIYACAR